VPRRRESRPTEGEAFPLLRGPLVVVLGPAIADEEDVADLDVAALGCGADVDALVFSHGDEIVVADGVGRRGVVLDAHAVGVAPIVEEDSSAGKAVVRPVVNAALVIRRRAENILLVRVVVECIRRDVSEMSEPIPLRA